MSVTYMIHVLKMLKVSCHTVAFFQSRESRVEFTFSSKWNHTDARTWGGMMVSVSRSTKRSQVSRYQCRGELGRRCRYYERQRAKTRGD